jgi:glycogen synthase
VELARALAARGVEIVLATEGARLPADRRAALRRIAGLVHDEGAFALEWMEEPWADVAAAGEWLLDLEARERPDVVHLNAFAHGALPFRAPKLVVGHSCVLSWFQAVRGEVAPPSWDRYRAAVAAGLRGADAIAAPSAWMAAALVRHHGPIPTPLVLPNGRDPARFTPAPKEERILGAGRLWDEGKNAAALVRIAPALPWPVYIAGETAGPTSHRSEETSSGTAATAVGSERGADAPASARGRSASFLGRLLEADLARWLASSAIFAHPARYEPFGLAVLEAALSGCALVLGDIPSLRETWEGAAEFAPPSDDAAIAARIRGLAGDPDRRRALGEAARARALHHGPARMAEAHLAAYRALLARPALAGARP